MNKNNYVISRAYSRCQAGSMFRQPNVSILVINKLKEKNHMVILTVNKPHDKISYPSIMYIVGF